MLDFPSLGYAGYGMGADSALWTSSEAESSVKLSGFNKSKSKLDLDK